MSAVECRHIIVTRTKGVQKYKTNLGMIHEMVHMASSISSKYDIIRRLSLLVWLAIIRTTFAYYLRGILVNQAKQQCFHPKVHNWLEDAGFTIWVSCKPDYDSTPIDVIWGVPYRQAKLTERSSLKFWTMIRMED